MEAKYVTTDLYLAAFLKSKGFKFGIEKHGKKSNFCFNNSEELTKEVLDYLNGDASCNPLDYSNSIKNLKNLVYNS
jgi:hypothetical protein